MEIHLVTNRHLCGENRLLWVIEEALKGGADVVQLREKDLLPRDLYALAVQVKALTAKYGKKLFINRSVEVALAVEADGVNLGYDSLPLPQVRKIFGASKIVGVSIHSVAEGQTAEREGAGYCLAGHIFPSTCKPGQEARGLAFLRELKEAVSIPIIAIGGIDEETIKVVAPLGVAGVAVMSRFLLADNPRAVAEKLKSFSFTKRN